MKNVKKTILGLFACSAVICAAACFAACEVGHEHDYKDTTVSPTCTEQGYTVHQCSCGDSYTDGYIDALGHDLEDHEGQAVTCDTKGWDAYQTCKRTGCGYTTYEETEAKGHTPKTIKPAKAATCTAKGLSAEIVCEDCGIYLEEQVVTPATGHKTVTDPAVASTCTTTGLTEGSHCEVCKTVFKAQKVTPMHNINTANKCEDCHTDLSTPGLSYTLKNGSYEFTGTGSANAEEILYIASEYEGVPVTSIGRQALKGSTATAIYIPDGVTCIGQQAFTSCNSLETLYLPDTIEVISQDAFKGVPSRVYNEYDGLYYIGSVANPYAVFVKPADKDITECTVKEGTKIISDSAFYNMKSLTSVTLPDSVTYIGPSAFEGCSLLTAVTVGGNVKTIDEYAFYGCISLTELYIGKNLKSVGDSAFYNCTKLKDIYFAGTQEEWAEVAVDPSYNNYFKNAAVHNNAEAALPTDEN